MQSNFNFIVTELSLSIGSAEGYHLFPSAFFSAFIMESDLRNCSLTERETVTCSSWILMSNASGCHSNLIILIVGDSVGTLSFSNRIFYHEPHLRIFKRRTYPFEKCWERISKSFSFQMSCKITTYSYKFSYIAAGKR